MFSNKNIFVALTYSCNACCGKCMTRCHVNRGKEITEEHLNRLYYLLKANNYERLLSVGTGEPLLYPGIKDFIANVLDINSKIRLRLLTNGMLLKPNDSDIFNKRCIWGVTMDAFNQETLVGLQRGVDIEKVKFNVKNAANRYGASNMYLNFTVYNTNVDEILPFVKFAVENGIYEIYLTELKVYKGFEKDMKQFSVVHDEHTIEIYEEAKRYLESKGISTYGIPLEVLNKRHECFNRNLASPLIDVDGSVSFCSGREDVYVGNILDEDIVSKWRDFINKVSLTNGKWCEKCHDRICADGTYSLPRTILKEKKDD